MTSTADVLQAVRDLVYSKLTVPPGRSLVAPGGQVAWDECCGGQLAVRLITDRPWALAQTPLVVEGYTASVGVSVVRCVSALNDQGQAPSATQVTADARQILDDHDEVRAALVCGLGSIDGIQRWTLGVWTPLGPDGGCAGGEWAVDLLLPNCEC